MKKVMILSLGGSPEPLKKSIAEYQPEHLIFFASHDSVLKSGEVLEIKAINPKKLKRKSPKIPIHYMNVTEPRASV